MPDLKELLAPIKAYMGEDEDKKTEVADGLHAELPGVAQVLIDKGAGLGKGELKKQMRDLKAELTATKEKLETAESDLEESRTKSPEEVQNLQKKVTKLEGQLAEATTKLGDEQTGRKQDRRDVSVERLINQLGGRVLPAAVKAIKAEYGDRIRIGEDGAVEVLQLDSDAVYAPAKGQDAIELLAADVLKKLPAAWRVAGSDSGGGQGGGGGGGSTEVTTDKLVEEKLQGNAYRTF